MAKSIRIFNGATSVVTGGASGIGRAIAEELSRRGSEVFIADRQVTLAQETASKINEAGGNAFAYQLDVRNFPEVESILNSVVNKTGRLDFMFNNAGIEISGPVHLHTIDDWNSILNINLIGVINGVQAAYKIMLAQGFGHIVNTSSIAGFQPSPGLVSYSTTKHGVIGLSIGLRPEAALNGIRVSVLCPGVVRTPILEGGKYSKNLINRSPDEQKEEWEKLKPMPADSFAVKALDAVAKNKAIIIVPSWWKIIWWLNRLSPSLMISFMTKAYEKLQKERLQKSKGAAVR